MMSFSLAPSFAVAAGSLAKDPWINIETTQGFLPSANSGQAPLQGFEITCASKIFPPSIFLKSVIYFISLNY